MNKSVLIFIALVFVLIIIKLNFPKIDKQVLSPTPAPTIFQPNIPKQSAKKNAYTILLVGDSIIKALGPNSDALRIALKKNYQDKVFGIFNYGQGSTSILSVKKILQEGNNVEGTSNPPILGREFELIIIESFGHNPLSEYSLDEGLKIQTKTLDEIIFLINSTHPNSVIAFMTPIAPHSKNYAKNSAKLSGEQSEKWAAERVAYIKNHMDFAKKHDIYLIDVYTKSLNAEGDGDLKYIDGTDFIHPSKEGIQLIGTEIAEYIFNNQILLP